MSKRSLPLTAATILLGATASLPAQSANDVVAYRGVMRTPVGALSPVMTNTLINRLQNGGSLSLRVGHVSGSSFENSTTSFGVTGVLPAGLGSTFSITGGVISTDCTGCKGELMLGGGGDIRLYASPLGPTSTSSLLTMSLDGEVGYSHADPGSFVSGYVGVPIALVGRGNGMQFVPFLTPGFGFAQFSAGGNSTSGSLMLVGGGVGIYNRSSDVSANVGVQHPFISGGQTMVGLSVTIGGK